MRSPRLLPILILSLFVPAYAWAANMLQVKTDDVVFYTEHVGSGLVTSVRLKRGTVVKDKVQIENGRHRVQINGIRGWIKIDQVGAIDPAIPEVAAEFFTPEQQAQQAAAAQEAAAAQKAAAEAQKAEAAQQAAADAQKAAEAKQAADAAQKAEAAKQATEAAAAQQTESKVCFTNLPKDKGTGEYVAYQNLLSHAKGKKIASMTPWSTSDKSSAISFREKSGKLEMVLKDLQVDDIKKILAGNGMIDSSMTSAQVDEMVGKFQFGLQFNKFPFEVKQICQYGNDSYFTMSLVGTGEYVGGVEGSFKLVPVNGAIGFKVTGDIGGSDINDTFSNVAR